MNARLAVLSLALLAAGCGNSTPPAASAGQPFVPGPDAPFAVRPDPTLSLPPCLLPAGTIGVPDQIDDPLPDRGNGRAAGDPATAPADLPAQLTLRSDTETFNRRYQFALRDGALWFKSNTAVTGIDEPWDKVAMPACLAGTVIGISLDDDELIAIRANGDIYGMDNALKDYALFNWSSRWGPPFWTNIAGWRLDGSDLAWSWSVISQREDRNWTDPAGNQHQPGAGKVSHIWLLRAGGQRYTYIDPWLALDHSYEMCGPVRGRFRGVNLSASGSTIFTVNRYGDLYTRNYDFDLCGADDVFFNYSYEDQRGVANPSIQLPTFDWLRQPKIPGAITHHISVHKVGADMQQRVLRVEGLDAGRHTGYWEKDYQGESAWRFVRTDRPLRGTLLDNRPRDSSLDDALPSEDRPYARNLERLDEIAQRPHVTGDDDWAGELPDFNFYCPPQTLRIRFSRSESLDLLLHTTDVIRLGPARARGLDDEPRRFNGDIEIPPATFATLDRLPPKSREFIALYLDSRRHTSVKLSGVSTRITVTTFGWEFTRP